MKLLAKIGEYVAMAIGFPALAACFLAAVCVLGILALGIPVWIVSLFSKHLADSLNHVLLPDWPLHLGLAIPVVAGCLSILCWSRISYSWERRRAIEQEIKTVSGIQIIEPRPPGPVERFSQRANDALERFFESYFGWTGDVADHLQETWSKLPFTIKGVCCIVLGFVLGATVFWVNGVSFTERPWFVIPLAVVVGWVAIYFAIMGLRRCILAKSGALSSVCVPARGRASHDAGAACVQDRR